MRQERLAIAVELLAYGPAYRAKRWIGAGAQWHERRGLDIGADTLVAIKGQEHPLSEFVAAMLSQSDSCAQAAFYLDEQGQLDVGGHLFDQLFGHLAADEQARLDGADRVDLRLIACDAWTRRLPWPLLARKRRFLAAGRWTITLACGLEALSQGCVLPPSPSLLIVAPNPYPGTPQDTKADQHVEELEERLRARDPLLSRQAGRVKLVSSWAECCAALRQDLPDALYYYGHGEGDEAKTRLVFGVKAGIPEARPLADLAHVIEGLERKPRIAYFNCCYGDAGGALSVGGQLADLIPALVTNRTVAFVEQARAQAVRFWECTLLSGMEPPEAVRDLYGLVGEPAFTLRQPRWMSPVAYCSHGPWLARAVRDATPLLDPHWHVKINREDQFDKVLGQTTRMLREETPRGVAFVWFGAEGDGMEQFHQRLNVELKELLPDDVAFREFRPGWPADMQARDPQYDICRSFREMYVHREVFHVNDLSDIPGRVRGLVGGLGRKTLLYIRHRVLVDVDRFNKEFLRQYLLWWDRQLNCMLDNGQFCLLGVSYQSANPLQFEGVLHKLGLQTLPQHGRCRVLNRLGEITESHLLDFVNRHKITIPEEGRREKLIAILERTGGKYELVIRELESLVERGWADILRQAEPQGEEDQDFV